MEVTGGKRERLLEVASGDGDSVHKFWVEDVANSSRSLSGGGVTSDVVSMVQISIWELSERRGFFRARVMSSGELPI